LCLYFYIPLLYPTYTLMQYKKGGLNTGFFYLVFDFGFVFIGFFGFTSTSI
jgi:hypothetical protein